MEKHTAEGAGDPKMMRRRSFLKAGALTAFGLSLLDYLKLRANAASTPARARSVLLIYAMGGVSHHESFDPKPGAPAEIRGEFNPIPTCLPGIRFTEHVPRLARMLDRFALQDYSSRDGRPYKVLDAGQPIGPEGRAKWCIFLPSSSRAHHHTRQMVQHGYHSSYTMPMYYSGAFFGFLFFDSCSKDRFDEGTLHALDVFALGDIDDIEALRNIATYHHEAMNGSGYPFGLADEEIPLEARIIAVADVFDALTSRRPYKRAWTNPEAFAVIQQMAGIKLDRDCVAALIDHASEVEEIQKRFREDTLG
jgi:hypothetical protein